MAKRSLPAPVGGTTTKLRDMAEELLKTQNRLTDNAQLAPEEVRKLTHELRVHQVELEMQNDELRSNQLELQEARDKYAALYDFAPVGYLTLDQKGLVVEANLTAGQLFGLDRNRMKNRSFGRFISPESQEAYFHFRQEMAPGAARHSIVLSMTKANGVPFIANVDSTTIADVIHKTQVTYLAISDITPLAEAERALRENEEKYRTLIGNVPVVTWTRDGQGTVTFISPNIAAVCGYTPEEIIGTDMRFWKRQIHPDDVPLVIHSFMQMLTKGQALDIEYRFRRKDGAWIWIQNRALRRSEERNTVRVDGMMIDITERKRAEEVAQDLQRKQVNMEKQAALGQIAAAVAHEINNPLAGIQNAFLLLKKAVPADHPHHMFVGLIDREIKRMAEIIRQMTLLYRPSSARRAECDAVAAVRETLQILATDTRSQGIAINVLNGMDELMVRMAEGELRQVIYNIVINALHVSKPSDKIEVMLDQSGDAARITVTDHGPGIADDILPHIFEPFFSGNRREEQGGMGLGLSVSRGLVEAAGGCIEVKTKWGEGTAFIVSLPCC